MRLLKIILSFNIYFITSIIFGQEQDSLIVNAKKTNNDSLIAATYNEVGFSSIFSDKKKALQIILEGKRVTKKSNFEYGFVRLTNTHGIYFDVIGNKDSANYYFNKSLDLAKKHNFKDLESKCLNNLGMFYWNQVDFNKALSFFFSSLELEEELGNTKDTANPLSNIGLIYQEMKLLDKALLYHFKALEIRKKYNEKRKIGLSLNNIGICYELEKNYRKAIKHYKEGIIYSESANDKINLTKLYDNIGNAYEKSGSFKNSITYYLKSLELSKEIKNDDKKIILTYSNLASVHNKIDNPQKALAYAEKGFLVLKENPQYLVYSEELYLFAAESNFRVGNIEKGRKLAEKSLKIKDSLFSEKNANAIANLETKYQTEKKEKEIAQQKEELLKNELEIKNKNLTAILLGSGLLFFSIISVGLYKRQQHKKRAYKNKLALKEAQTYSKLQDQRLRISRDLHDNIGSQLTFIISSIDNLKFLTDATNEKLKNKLSEINQFASTTISQLRDTIWAMNKNEIPLEEFQSRLLAFIEKAKSASSGVQFIFNSEIKSNITFSSIKGMNIFRVFQEAINNALKYAEATEINLHISENETTIEFEITDNGKGFDLNTIELGNGLENMQRRIKEVDGVINIHSEQNKGTTIKITCSKNKTNAV